MSSSLWRGSGMDSFIMHSRRPGGRQCLAASPRAARLGFITRSEVWSPPCVEGGAVVPPSMVRGRQFAFRAGFHLGAAWIDSMDGSFSP